MKIVCDNCATKYSIADEKVRGKVFKIRCKKCSHIIVVRGTEGGDAQVSESSSEGGAGFAEEQATVAAGGAAAATSGAGDSVWHLVIDREQVGPMTTAEVRAKFAAGQVDAETYAWREGFGDWLRLASIDDFKDLGAAPAGRAMHEAATQVPQSMANADATRRSDVNDLFGQQPQEEAGAADLFGGKGAAPASASFAAAAGAGEDLFGNAATAATASPLFSAPTNDGRGRPSAGSPFGGGAPALGDVNGNSEPAAKMTGQRNENSVLFSLNNLQALATGSGGGGARGGGAASAPAADAPRPGYASAKSEGSGLIDIRAMAAQTLSAAPAPSMNDTGDLPAFNAAPVFSPVVAAPILMPTPQTGMPKWVWGILGGGLLAVGAIVILLVVVLTRKEPAYAVNMPNPATTGALTPGGVQPAAVVNPSRAAPAADSPKGEKADDKAAAAEKTPAEKSDRPAPSHKEPHAVAAAPHHERAKRDDSGAGAPAPAPVASAPERKPPKKGGGDDLDDLLNGASGGGSKPAARSAPRAEAPPADDPNLPDQLQRGDIVSGMASVNSRVHGCFEQYKVPGTAMVSLVIAKSGRVQSANVQGALSGTPTGDCVGRAVKGASFKKFKGQNMSISYPFILR